MRKLRAREEAACIALLSGVTQAEAYREAYPTAKNWKPNAVAVKACELFKRPEVKARLEELRATASERNNITVDTLLAELEANRLAALNAPTPQVSAAVAATMGKAKLLGLDKQVINHVGGSGTSQTPTWFANKEGLAGEGISAPMRFLAETTSRSHREGLEGLIGIREGKRQGIPI